MIKKGKTTEELRNQFLQKTDLQCKFEKFVEECEHMEIQKHFLEEAEYTILEQGVVVMEGINYPRYLFSGDMVI